MTYNYPRLQLNFSYLQKYDIVDKKLMLHKVSFICMYRTQIKSASIEKVNFLSTLLTQEWFCGQKSAIQNYFLPYEYSKKEIYFKTTLRKLSFWNLLDLCINSIFVQKPQSLPDMIFYFEKTTYLNSFSFNLWQNNFLFSKLKENSSAIYQLKRHSSIKLIHFYFN